jgi:hypothetical protein
MKTFDISNQARLITTDLRDCETEERPRHIRYEQNAGNLTKSWILIQHYH